MDEPLPQPAAPARSSWGIAILAFAVIGSSGVGVLIYQSFQNKEAPVADKSGFDIADAPGAANPAAPAAPAASGPAEQTSAQSSLGMVQTGLPGVHFGGKVKQPPGQKTKATFAELVRQSEAKMTALTQRFEKRFPIIRQYQQEWRSHPDLRKLNDDYNADHDPVKFMRGLSESKNFGNMVKKYAGQAPVQSFVKDAMKEAPSGFMSAAMDYLNDEKVIKKLVDNVAGSLGLPPGLLSGTSSEPKVDEKAVMDSIMKGNPDVQKAMQNPDVQKNLPNQPR